MSRPGLLLAALVFGIALPASSARAQTEPAPEQGGQPYPFPEPAPLPEPTPLPAPVPEPVPAPVEPEPISPLTSEPPPAPEPQPSAAAPAAPPAREAPDPAFRDWGEPGSDPPPPPLPPFQAAVMLGVGASFDETPGGVNPLGFGFGVRGDFRVLPELAIGARFLYFIGGSTTLPAGEIGMASWLLGAEASYVYRISGMVLEPGAVLGVLVRAIDGRSPFVDDGAGGFVPGSSDDSQPGFYFAPGASLVVPMTMFSPDLDPFFIGGDARIGFVFGEDVSGSLELMIQAGLSF